MFEFLANAQADAGLAYIEVTVSRAAIRRKDGSSGVGWSLSYQCLTYDWSNRIANCIANRLERNARYFPDDSDKTLQGAVALARSLVQSITQDYKVPFQEGKEALTLRRKLFAVPSKR